MQIYLVGGAVRDELLGRPVTERDYVVVGASPVQMQALGYVKVGADFPVFLHPITKEEYALARTERKQGRGYRGFVCDSAPHVTLEQDLLRRDLTINAMAKDAEGNIIDPFGGQQDIKNRVMRHVSDAFVEDPLRVFRVARLAARYHHLGFGIANQTLSLMRNIAQSGELSFLSAERVWQETSRSLLAENAEVFFATLKACDALGYWFKELELLWGIPNPSQWHPEIDTGIHTMMVVKRASELSKSLAVRYAALVHDLGKGQTSSVDWPSHRGHDALGLSPIKAISKRLKVPNECAELALLVSEHHSTIHRLYERSPQQILAVLNACDAWRKPERFTQVLLSCQADFQGRKTFESRPYPQYEQWQEILNLCNSVNAAPFVAQGCTGAAIKEAIEQARLKLIRDYLQSLTT